MDFLQGVRHTEQALCSSKAILTSPFHVQLLLGSVRPATDALGPDSSVWWQALNSWQYLMSRLLTWMCCGFGGRGHMTADSAGSHTRHSKHPSSGTPATSTTHDHTNPATALLTSTPGTHGDVIDLEANNAQRTADTAASPRSAVAPGDLATFEVSLANGSLVPFICA